MLPSQTNYVYNKWIYPFVLSTVVFIGLLLTAYTIFTVDNNNKRNLTERADTLAQVFTAEDLSTLFGSTEDLSSPDYINIKEKLLSIRRVNPDVRFIYINGMEDSGNLFFYADSEEDSSKDYSPPGEIYPEATELMVDVIRLNKSGFERSRDRWGYWFSAYSPIIDKNTGKAVALVGLDVPAETYIINTIAYGTIPLLFTFIILLLMFFSQRIRKREKVFFEKREEFLSVASHEIRMPLTGIKWATENILNNKNNELKDETRDAINQIHSNTISLIERLNNFLSLSAIEHTRKVEVAFEKIKLSSILENILDNFYLTASAKKVEITIDKTIDQETTVYGDFEKTRQILVNLVSNAIKYTNPGTKIDISLSTKDDFDNISIQDHGNGISDDDLKHIFDGYIRTEEAKHSQNTGTGIGLHLVQKMAKIQGGKITVLSTTGKGTTAVLSLPHRK